MGLFVVFSNFDRFFNSFFGKYYVRLTPTNLLNSSMYFDLEYDQLFSKNQAQNVNLNVHEFHLMCQN